MEEVLGKEITLTDHQVNFFLDMFGDRYVEPIVGQDKTISIQLKKKLMKKKMRSIVNTGNWN